MTETLRRSGATGARWRDLRDGVRAPAGRNVGFGALRHNDITE
jgi:hypothetical protein